MVAASCYLLPATAAATATETETETETATALHIFFVKSDYFTKKLSTTL